MHKPSTYLFLTLLSALCLEGCAHGREARPFIRHLASSEKISLEKFRQEIVARRQRVSEFAFLTQWAESQGVRLWIAGGSAAGFAHYVKADLEREASMERGEISPYFSARFQYRYFQIFRSTQDADIILDGNEKQAQALESELRQKFDYLQGSKSVWEVRLLREPRGQGTALKEPLINNSNFTDQNSDSHSTGMIELTTPPATESTVRDLFDWGNQHDPRFLKDVANGELHYYANPKHHSTSRAQAGLNPPILSVIRYFTKAFQ